MTELAARWYKMEGQTAANKLLETVQRVARDNQARRADDQLFLTMYGSSDIAGYGEDRLKYDQQALKYNIARVGVNTAEAFIGALRPKPRFQTNDADWDLVTKAKACDHAVNAVFDQNNFYGLASEAFKDAAVSSLGGLKVFTADGKVKIERVYPGEIMVDIREGYYGRPRNIYQAKLVDKDALKTSFPGNDTAIDAASTQGAQLIFGWINWTRAENQVLVIEGFHLGQYNKKTGKYPGGQHTIAIANKVLFAEEWDREGFPYAFYRWEKRQAGFYGRGIVEELRVHQRTLNYIDIRIRDMMHSLSRGKLVVWNSKNVRVNVEHMTNDPADIINVQGTGQAPTVMNRNAVPTEWWKWRTDTIQDGLQQIGFNEWQVSATKPPGIEAGVALRELREQGTRRARIKVQGFEQFILDVARLVVQELRAGAESGEIKALRATVQRGALTTLQMVDWSKVGLAEDEYNLTITPASSLPDTTAGRIATVTDWYKAGLITQMEFKALLDMPDLERFKSLDLAAYEVILDAIDVMIEDGEFVSPEPTDDLELLVSLATLSISKFRLRKAPEDRLELLRRYVDDAEYLQEKAVQGLSEIEQTAAQTGAAVTGIQQATPGGATPHEAARIVEAGQNIAA